MKFEQIKEWYIENNLIFFVSFELTQKCNFRCKHCYCPDKTSNTLSLDDMKIVIDKLYDIGCFLLIFTGGEIFTYPYFKDVYTYAKKKGFMIDIMTNGSRINTEYIELFKQLPPHNISVTVYGADEEEYEKFTGSRENYKKVMETLKLLKNNNFKFNIRTVATKTLCNSIKTGRFDCLAEQLKVSFRYDPIIFPKVSGDKTPLDESLSPKEIVSLEGMNSQRSNKWKELIALTDEYNWKCRAGINSFAIDYKGDAYVCGLYRENGISIVKEEIGEVLEHLKEVHKKHENIMDTNECRTCKFRKICKWCPAYARVYNGTENEKINFFCELARARSEHFGQ